MCAGETPSHLRVISHRPTPPICAVMCGLKLSDQSSWTSADYVVGWIGWLVMKSLSNSRIPLADTGR
jgi:hypothetical protein